VDTLEIEVKIRFPDAGEARRAVLSAGGAEVRPRHFEENSILDTPAGDLAARSALLRVRSASDGRAFLTFKEKVPTEARAKIRIEREVEVSSAEILAAILRGAGFVPIYRYQKYRTVFSLGAATVDLDETPMGCFIEIEGSREAIASAASRLGASEADFIVEDYRALFREWREARGLPPGDMVFEDERPAGGGSPTGAAER
jgi:adenylate cyclase, class 2